VTSATGIVLLPAAAAISYGLLILLRPLLAHHALAKPNLRSSHSIPTPQGGGIAVIAATIIVGGAATLLLSQDGNYTMQLAVVFAAAAGLAAVGATDDLRPLEALPRLLLQAAAFAAVTAALPPEMRFVPWLPWWLDRAVVLVGGIWLVNVVNFMDGIDWMTVAEVVPVTAGLAVCGLIGALPPVATFVALALCGAMIGFAPFNRPVARLFLGDVGSLPIGLLLAWLLALLAGNGYLAAALLLPLYYLADATVTLMRRLASGEPITQAHRDHFYQRALDGGMSVYQIVGRVFGLNVVLAALAALMVTISSPATQGLGLTAGAALVSVMLFDLGRAGRAKGRRD
jgi:UDP-N-acetylmuramyl pentapeptide phosphotransferase/UDP-N-acetylglucosamine-1-phosphate transferase